MVRDRETTALATITKDVIDAAQTAMKATGIPASVTIAQWALESGWGKHMPPGSNNPFGMKVRVGKNDPFVAIKTREVINGKEVFPVQNFRKFASIADAFEAHAQLLLQPVYAKCRKILPDAILFARSLQGVYATDPKYADLLTSIIRGSNLLQYDKVS